MSIATKDEYKHRLIQQLEKNEQLEREIDYLREELENMRLIHIITTDIATVIEEDLKTRLEKATNGNGKDESSVFLNDNVVELTRKLSMAMSRIESFALENARLRNELTDLRIMHSTVTENATILENELEKQYEEVALASVTDPLTKIFNRAGFIENFNRLTTNDESLFSVIMFDIDHFKNVNDTHGHDAGDLILQNVVVAVSTVIRKEDVFARWGGEEFIILLPDIDYKSLKIIAERIRFTIEQFDFPVVERITCSFGATQHLNRDTMDTFLKRVDEGLYKAKKGGRNRIVFT